MKKIPERKGMRMKENRKLLKEVLKDIQHDMSDEEVLNLLADSKISESPTAEKYTIGQRAADAIAKFAGSWAFIFAFTGVLILWMVINTILAAKAFDPYPFILLNLVLSCVAAIQAPLIMMSQNRQEEKDRRRAENDYKVNLKTEIMIEDLYDMDLVLTGHAHGGQFRLPLIGGLIAPNQGLFAKYDDGLYSEGNTNMIVSRGLGNSIIPFRFNNRPEVVLIELKGQN